MGEALTTEDWSDELRSDLSDRARALADKHPLYPQLRTAAAAV